MSDNSNITREDLIAVGYVIYTALYEKGVKPLDHTEFAANCEKAFKEFSNCSDE